MLKRILISLKEFKGNTVVTNINIKQSNYKVISVD